MEPHTTPDHIRQEDVSQKNAPEAPPARSVFRPPSRVIVLLFVATCASTVYAGRGMFHVPDTTAAWMNGLQYAGALMLMLLAHEMGHFLQTLRYHVPASWPYFIPMPITFFGTMGAVIVQGRQAGDRKALFDIAVSGPIAGLVIALPVTWYALSNATTALVPENFRGLIFGDPLIMQWMYSLQHGPLPPGHEITLTPLLFAGWVGIFITALNLIPVGQLDGGHILYALLRRRAWTVATLVLWGAVAYVLLTRRFDYAIIIVLLFLMGAKHPPTGNDHVPLGWPRIVLGWLTLAFIIIGFTPQPLQLTGS